MTLPPEALAPDGSPWWTLKFYPGKRVRFGVEPKIAAWLTFNASVGDTFTLRELRSALGEPEKPNDQEHFNRRMRELRKFEWLIPSSKDDSRLRPDEYRLDRVGHPIWLGKSQFRSASVSNKLRRQVLDRDGHRCVVCGIGAGEPYPDDPDRKARLTVGHVVADSFDGKPTLHNLRAECSRCNEPVREEANPGVSYQVLVPRVRQLRRADKHRLLGWLTEGHRTRDEVDRIYDDARALPAGQRDDLIELLRRMV